MAQKIELDQILEKQKACVASAEKLQGLEGDAVVKESKKVEREVNELQAMCLVFDQQVRAESEAKWGKPPATPHRIVKVQLTDEQRQRVLDQTGIRIEVVELIDGTDVAERTMPDEYPPIVEAKAIKKAEAMKQGAAATEDRKAAKKAAFDELSKLDHPDAKKALKDLLSDPEMQKILKD